MKKSIGILPIVFKRLTAFIIVLAINNCWSQENVERLKFGSGLIYTPSYNLVQQSNSGNLDQNTFETITNEESGRIVHPLSLYFSYDPIAKLRLKLGIGTQYFGYKSPKYKSELAEGQIQEVSFKLSNRYFQIPIGLQFFVTKSLYLEASYVSLFLINTKLQTLTKTKNFDDYTTYISRKGYESYNQIVDFSIGYQARLGESSISLQIAPKISYSPSFSEIEQAQIRRSNLQFGLSFGIHSFL